MSTTLEAPSAPILPPPVAMTQIITGGLWITKSIYVAAEHGVVHLHLGAAVRGLQRIDQHRESEQAADVGG